MAERPTLKELREVFETGEPKRPEDVIGVWVWRISLAYQRRADTTVKEFGLTHLQFVLLITCTWLNLTTDAVSQRDLALEIGMQEAQLSVMVKALKARKLVAQRASAADSRVREVTVTTAGLRLLATVLPHMRRMQSELWPSEKQNEQLTRTIKAILGRWTYDKPMLP